MLHKLHAKTDVDDHVFIHIECEGRPGISIDIINWHGHRSLSVRSDGHSIFGGVVDVNWLEPAGTGRPMRFCPMCGEKIDLFSSAGHECPDDKVIL